MRWDAAEALGKIGDPRPLPDLERVAREDTGETAGGSKVKDAADYAIISIKGRQD